MMPRRTHETQHRLVLAANHAPHRVAHRARRQTSYVRRLRADHRVGLDPPASRCRVTLDLLDILCVVDPSDLARRRWLPSWLHAAAAQAASSSIFSTATSRRGCSG